MDAFLFPVSAAAAGWGGTLLIARTDANTCEQIEISQAFLWSRESLVAVEWSSVVWVDTANLVGRPVSNEGTACFPK